MIAWRLNPILKFYRIYNISFPISSIDRALEDKTTNDYISVLMMPGCIWLSTLAAALCLLGSAYGHGKTLHLYYKNFYGYNEYNSVVSWCDFSLIFASKVRAYPSEAPNRRRW